MPNILTHHTYAWQMASFLLSLLPVGALVALVFGSKFEKLGHSIR